MATSSLGSGEETLSLGGLDSTPRLLPRNYVSPTRHSNDQASNLNLRLTSVVGNTVSSVHGFSWTEARPCFATCSGSLVTLRTVDEECNITQRFFRARPTNGSLPNGLENGTPPRADVRKSQVTSLRTSNFRIHAAGAASPSQDTQTTSVKAAARMGTRSSTCVALSPDGNLLAAGEASVISLEIHNIANLNRPATALGYCCSLAQERPPDLPTPRSQITALVSSVLHSPLTLDGSAQ